MSAYWLRLRWALRHSARDARAAVASPMRVSPRRAASTFLEVAGLTAIVTGVGLLFVPAAFIVAGLLMLLIAQGIEKPGAAS